MTLKIKNQELDQMVKKLQEGGEMASPAEEPVTAPAQEPAQEDPTAQILQAAVQAVQTQDCNLAMQVLQALLQMAQGGQEAPAEAPGQPVYRKGGKLSKWV